MALRCTAKAAHSLPMFFLWMPRFTAVQSASQRLLIVSHACVTPINQEIFAAVENLTGWDIHLVVPATWKSEYGERSAKRWETFDGGLHPVPVIGSGNIPLHVYRSTFQRLLRRIAPDAVFVHHEPYALATVQLYAANAISVRAPIGYFTWQNLRKRYPPPFRQLEEWVYRTSTFAFAGSQSATDVLRAKGYEGPVGRLPGTVDPERFAPQSARAAWCAQYGVDPAALLVGYAGRLIEAKGLFTLLEALALMDGPSPEMVFIGEGAAKADLKAQARALGLTDRIRWISYVPHPEMPEALSAMDLMVLPSETQASWKEQFGRIIIESLACGTPIVGSDSGEIPHLLRYLGQDTIVPEGEAHALAAELSALLQDPERRSACAARGRARIENEFTVERVASSFVETLVSTTPLTRKLLDGSH